jgi:predicted  nucleic acid-binding Zn-ribbon protein
LASDGKEGISKEDYMARLQESKEALQEAEMSIRDGIAQIGDELENTFDLVDEKLDQQFTKFDRLIELMDHYKNIVSLTEGEASYKEFNKILKASQEVLRDRIEADKSEVAMWESRRKQLEADIATLPEDSPAKREAEEAL